MIYALIKDQVVGNVIKIGELSFLDRIRDDWDSLIDVTNETPRPGVGWLYDGTNFTDNIQQPPETPGQQEARERSARLEAIKSNPATIPITGQNLQDLLRDILDSL